MDADALVRAFRDAFDEDFETIGHRVARDERYGTCCLIEARPRRAGFFVVRYDVSHDCRRHPGLGDGRRSTWYLAIGEEGRPRTHVRGAYGNHTHPFANVGDTITFPVNVDPVSLRHRFSREPTRAREAEVMAESDKEQEQRAADVEWPPGKNFGVRGKNDVEESLALLRAGASSNVSRGGDFALHYLGGLFEAKKPDRFTLRVTSPGKPYMPGDPLSVVIVPKGTALRTYATRLHTDGDTDHVPPGTLYVREGDRLSWTLWVHRTKTSRRGETGRVLHPPLRIERLPLKDKPWPFGHAFLAPAAGR